MARTKAIARRRTTLLASKARLSAKARGIVEPVKKRGRGNVEVVKKQRRNRPGTRVRREIVYYQRSTDLVIPKAPMIRFLRQVAEDVGTTPDIRFQAAAAEILRRVSEDYLLELFVKARKLCENRGQQTIQLRDIVAAAEIMQEAALDKRHQSPGLSAEECDTLKHSHFANKMTKVYAPGLGRRDGAVPTNTRDSSRARRAAERDAKQPKNKSPPVEEETQKDAPPGDDPESSPARAELSDSDEATAAHEATDEPSEEAAD